MPEIDDAAVIALFMDSVKVDEEIRNVAYEILSLKADIKTMMRESGIEDLSRQVRAKRARQEELEEKARRMRREAANKRTDPEQMEIPA